MGLRKHEKLGVLKKTLDVQTDNPKDLGPMLSFSEQEVDQHLPHIKEELGKDGAGLSVCITQSTKLGKTLLFGVSRGVPALGFGIMALTEIVGFGVSVGVGVSMIAGGNMFYDLYGKERLNPNINISLRNQGSEQHIPRIEELILRQGIGRKLEKACALNGVP